MKDERRVSRRTFLKATGLSGVAFTLGCTWPVKGVSKGVVLALDFFGEESAELMAWITIGRSGKVTLFNHRSEMGQGTWQAIPQIVAEELEVDMDQVAVQYVAADPEKYGPQPQEGSYSIRGWCDQLLRMGATAREMLIEAAAREWNVDKSECFAQRGEVRHRPSGKKRSYGELVTVAAKIKPPEHVKLKARKDYHTIGQPLPRKDTPLKTNGTAVFGMDKKLPGMLYAVVERSPRLRGKVKTIDDAAARSFAGVKNIFKIQRPVFGVSYEGVAIVADTLWAAIQGRKLLKVDWDDSGFEHLNSETIATRMQHDLLKPAASDVFELSLKKCSAVTEALYEVPYQSHSCMEPLNCTADVRDDSIEIWGPIQEANWIQADLSDRFGLPKNKVKVNMTFLGGGFGRKGFPDFPFEAAFISKTVRAPVQVVWTREDDMTMGPFRSGGAYRCRGGIDAHGKISALQVITATQTIGPGQLLDEAPGPVTENSRSIAGLLPGYLNAIPHYSFGWVSTKSPIPILWWRAPIANVDAFAGESFVDELARLASRDPLEFRKEHLVSPRTRALLDRLATVSRWDTRTDLEKTPKEKREGWGVAITDCFGSMVGQVVKVSGQPEHKTKITKVYAVIDCGWYVNPDIIRAQVEGSIVMAMGASIFHATHFKDGRAVEQNFDAYRMPRIGDIPEIEVHIMENDEKPGGVGEPAVPAFAPALCNAIFDLTGKRIRKLPFKLDEIG